MVIDGTTQPAMQVGPSIVLDGRLAGRTASGLVLEASNSTVKGLDIESFAVAGLVLDGASNDVISHNYIGVNFGGTAAASNDTGVILENGWHANTIGGVTPQSHNLISGKRGAASKSLVPGRHIMSWPAITLAPTAWERLLWATALTES